MRNVSMCDVCRRVLDDIQQQSAQAPHWIEVQRYLNRHLLASTDVTFTSTYCADCRHSYDVLMTYGSLF